uniref:Chromo domain containing protein n=2 Tax=Haemonchus contortus TaxID=6289 RepID=A0A7I4XWZ7_HAECO
MDEGDEYVPQMSQLGDYSGMGGMGMSQGQPPSVPGYSSMSGGLTPMNNPYEQQMMMMGQPSQPVQKPAPASKSRSKKKQEMDPMQSMAAMSNNPMIRPSMQQMGGMYPPQSGQMSMYGGAAPQQSPHFPPQGVPPGYRPQYAPQPGYPGMQQPMYATQQTQQQRSNAYATPQPTSANHYGYGAPPQTGYPPQQYPPPQMRPQYPQGQQALPMQNQYWEPQQHPYYQQQQQPQQPQQSAPNMHPNQPDQWGQQSSQQMYHLEMDMRGMQQRLQHLYQQQRTPMIEQEIQQIQMRLQYLQAEHLRLQQMAAQSGQTMAASQQQQQQPSQQQQQPQTGQPPPGMASMPNANPSMPMNQQMPTPGMGPPSGPSGGPPSQQVVIQQSPSATPATPVQVTQSGSQVQVNIKPETSGRTLISVYHRFGESPNGDEAFNCDTKDSVPPEPTPTQQQQQYQDSQQLMSPPPPHHHQQQIPQQQIPQQQIPPQHIQQHQPHPLPVQQQPLSAPPQQQITPQVPAQQLHQMPQVNGMDNGYQNNGVQHSHNAMETVPQMQPPQPSPQVPTTVELKPTVFNPYAETKPESEPETEKREEQPVEEQEKPPEVKVEAPSQDEVEEKPTCVIPEPLIQPSANLFDDRDDATPPMRTDAVEEVEAAEEQQEQQEQRIDEIEPKAEPAEPVQETEEPKESSPGPGPESESEPPVSSAGGIAAADYSTLSDETQPAIAVPEDLKEEEEEEEEHVEETDEKSEDTTNLAIAEDEETKVEVEAEEDASDEPTPGPSSSRDPSPEESEVTESEPPSVKPSKRSRNKDRVATLSKEEVYDDRDATPSEVADSTDGVFTEPSTPAPESRKPKRLPVVRSRKKKSVDDSGDDDDDFVPDGRSRKSSKRGTSKPSKEVADDDDKRSSSKWGDAVDGVDDDAEDSILTTDSQETQSSDHHIVEKILNQRDGSDGGEQQYLVKWKGKAYVHCEWKTLKELEEVDKRAVAKVKRFRQKKSHSNNDNEEEDFNSDYTVVDRVVDVGTGDDGLEYALVKWKSLAYDEVTWEPVESIPEEKVALWRKRQVIDKAKVKEKPRPKANEWSKMPDDIIWKDGNTLREYQFEGVDWLLYCYYNERNCILADEMGLGKTVQTITFLSQIYEYGIHGPFLIVVPLSTIHNWVREFETWTDMNAVVYHGSQHSRDVIQQYEIYYAKQHSSGNKSWRKNLVKLDALITTFEMVVTDCEFLRKIPFRVCVIDEAHRLKNRNCKLLTGGLHAFRMEHRVLLTGTPLQNNIEELFSLLNFLHPQQFSSSAAFLEQFGQCQSDEQVQKLQEILKPMMLRRLKEDVEKSLQPKEETIIEVQLSDMQKKYYRAILERNFSHLCKGSSAPSLMNVMMELRKCCNHPFLIQGAEETILSELRLLHPEWDEETLAHKALVQASGKVVLIEKLLPKLRNDGHKVLIFSQMVKVLDLLEEFLVNMNYPFERIDGNVRGDMRQASIDRFSKKDSDRFVFLLCTRAGGLGINLTAADTVIIFDSDWNPQNDLQAQARCHRIGQTKMVKVYRLVTANTYEREMFDKASLKLGLDKAVLQSTTALKESSTSLSKKDVEELLKKGAYGSIMDENVDEGSKFSEEDIETILQRRTTTITLEPGQKGSLFAKAAFNSTHNRGDDIDIDDPNFWTKWAEKAQVDIEKATATPDSRDLIMQEPRKRTKRFEENSLKEGEDSDGSDEMGKGRKRGAQGSNVQSANRKRRRGDDEDGDYVNYRPDELAFNKSEYFKVEKVLASWGWGRWAEMKKSGELEVSEMDIAHMARTLLLHCVREYRGDERVRQTVWQLIAPQGAKNAKEAKGSQSIYHQGWAALPEFNPPNFALDASFQRHVHRHANKLLVKIDQLRHLQKTIIGNKAADIEAGAEWSTIDISVPTLIEPMCDGWDADCDKCLLIGIYKHGLDNVDAIRADEKLCFATKTGLPETFPGAAEISTRFRRLIAVSQRNITDPVYEKLREKKCRWSRREEQEYMRVLRSFGMKDKRNDPTMIDWDAFRAFSPLLEKKSDEEMQEHLYCILAMCTKAQGGELSALDTKRALSVDAMTSRKAQKLMNRLHLTRKVHALAAGLDKVTPMLKLCCAEAMPSGWTTQHDKELISVCDQHGIDNISSNILQKPAFQKIIRPTEKTLLRRVIEVCTTVETGKWNGTATTDSVDDSDAEERVRAQQQVRRGRKRAVDSDAQKMRALMQQSMLSQMGDLPLAAAMLQSAMFMPQLMGNNAAAAQLLGSLFAMAAGASGTTASSSGAGGSATAGTSAAASSHAAAALLANAAVASSTNADADVLNLTKKAEPSPSTTASQAPSTSSAPAPSTSQQQQQSAAAMAQLGLNELIILASLPPDTRIPVQNVQTKERLLGESAPKLKNLSVWLASHPAYTLDLASLGKEPPPAVRTPVVTSAAADSAPSSAKPSAPPTPKPSTPKPLSAATTPAPSSKPVSATPTPAPLTPKAETSPRLEPGEIPKKASNAGASSSAGDGPVSVFSRLTGALLPASKWPTLSKLASWLDAHPEANVHSSSVPLAQLVVGISHPDRLGGDPVAVASAGGSASTAAKSTEKAASSNSVFGGASLSGASSSAASAALAAEAATKQQLEALQMQMLMQQTLLQQSLLGFNPYALTGSASSTSSANAKAEDLLNPLLMASLMTNPLAIQSLLMDPTALAALSLAGSAGAGAANMLPSGSAKKSKTSHNS